MNYLLFGKTYTIRTKNILKNKIVYKTVSFLNYEYNKYNSTSWKNDVFNNLLSRKKNQINYLKDGYNLK